MRKLPTKTIILTEEKWDRLLDILNVRCSNDPDTYEIANDINAQLQYNPNDESKKTIVLRIDEKKPETKLYAGH